MDSKNLTDRQVRHLLADVCVMMHYLTALQSRMQQLRFPDDDPIWWETEAARIAMQRLLHAAQRAGQPMEKPLGDE